MDFFPQEFFIGKRNRNYELLATNIFSPLSKLSRNLDQLETHDELELTYDLDEFTQSPYYDEAIKHLTMELPSNISSPEQLLYNIKQYNLEVLEFLNQKIPNLIKDYLKSLPKLSISKDPNNLPHSAVLLPFLLDYLNTYWKSDGEYDPELKYEHGKLMVGNIKTLADIPPELEDQLRGIINGLKADTTYIHKLYGTLTEHGLLYRRHELVEDGKKLSKYIDDKILFKIEKQTYDITCDECPKK